MKTTAIATSVGASSLGAGSASSGSASSVAAFFPGRALFWLFAALFSGVSQAEFDIYQQPLVSSKSMDPNVIYIHDDSTSMRSSYMPQDANNAGGNAGFLLASPFWNNMYYNPELTYQPPYKHDGGTKLVRYPNSDQITVFPQICADGYNCTASTGTKLTLRAGANGRFTTAFPTGGDLSNTVNNNQVPAYWDYVPGYSSMRDNPNYDPKKRPEDDRGNYEYWAFRKGEGGALFQNRERSVGQNNALINNRACPTIFREQRDGKNYYAGVKTAGVDAKGEVQLQNTIFQVPAYPERGGVAHAHCRRSYRVYEPYESGIMALYTGTSWYTNSRGRGVVPTEPDVDLSNDDKDDDDANLEEELPIYTVYPKQCYETDRDDKTGQPKYFSSEPGTATDAQCNTAGFEDELGVCEEAPNTADAYGCTRANRNSPVVCLSCTPGVNCPSTVYDPAWAEPTENSDGSTTPARCETRSYATCWQQKDQKNGGTYVSAVCPEEKASSDDDGGDLGAVPESPNLPRGRRWCTRSTGYANRNIRAGTLGFTSDVNNNAYVSWISLTSAGTGTPVTCYSGRHAIGDSTGKGWYDPDVDGDPRTSTRLVSHFEYKERVFVRHATGSTVDGCNTAGCTSAQKTRAQTALNEVKDSLAATCTADGICWNLLGAEQSREHRVRKFVDNAGNLVIEDVARRRTVAEEIRNYMNWYSYYRTRNLLAKSGMSLAFANVINPSDTTTASAAMRGKFIRLGYDTINSASMETSSHGTFTATQWGGSSTRGPGQNGSNKGGLGVMPFRDVPAGEKVLINGEEQDNPYGTGGAYAGNNIAGKPVKRFYDWVNKLEASGNTPLHRALNSAGQYYMTKAPWMEYPNPVYTTDINNKGKGQELSCRRSFAILMTDGYSNSRTNRVQPTRRLNGGNVDCALNSQWPVIQQVIGGKVIKSSHDPQNPILYAQSPFCGEFQRSGGPYRVRGSLADVAMFYWGTNLRPQPENIPKVSPTKKDRAFWPHMQTFTIGMGVQGRLSDIEVNNFLANPNSFRAEDRKVPLWTNPTGLDTNYEQVDDLMHAGLTGRGGTIAAADADEFVNKLTALLTQLAGDAGSDATVAGSGVRTKVNHRYTTGYEVTSTWAGSVKAYKTKTCLLKDNSGKDIPGKEDTALIRAGGCSPGALIEPPVWEADRVLSDQLILDTKGTTNDGALGTRNIITWFDGRATPFVPTNTELARAIDNAVDYGGTRGKCPIPGMKEYNERGDYNCRLGGASGKLYDPSMLIYYLRGSRVHEDTSNESYVGATYYGFRNRADADETNIGGRRKMFVRFLGDIINSAAYVQGNFDHNDAGWGGVPDPFYPTTMKEVYKGRVAQKHRDRNSDDDNVRLGNTTVYVGANDGMLHAFDGLTGKELFAYVPAGVHKKLKLLADPEYDHKHEYFVDGSPFVRDIILDGEWRAVLVGNTGRGGRSFFALDVHEPENFSAANVLWEITGDDNHDLGYPVDGEGVITPVKGLTNKWGVIFGNGYNSRSGKACLFVVSLERSPHHEVHTMCVPDQGRDNGLGVPIHIELADTNNSYKGESHFAYAGDVLGNFWKFNLENLYSEPQLLLKATSHDGKPQPITAPALPVGLSNGSLQLVFGTGKYFEQSDVVTPRQTDKVIQSLYGIRDNPRSNTQQSSSGTTIVRLPNNTNTLMERKFVSENAGGLDQFCGILTGNTPSLCNSYTSWRLASNGANDPVDGDYRNDFGPKYGDGEDGYVIDFNAPRMENVLMGAQGTIAKVSGGTATVVLPTKITHDDPCFSSNAGSIVELNPLTGGWIKSAMFEYVEKKSNVFILTGSYGDEINRDSKYSISGESFDGVYVNDTRTTVRGLVLGPANDGNGETVQSSTRGLFDCTRFGSGDDARGGQETMYPPGSDELINSLKACGGRSGRQSWRQLR